MRDVTNDTGGPDDAFPGALVTWLHTPKGGYGYTMPVDAKVVKATADRALIEVTTKTGETVLRSVALKNLRWRK